MNVTLGEALKLFWLVLTGAAMLWYTSVTIYVAFKGIGDIREMLRNLKDDFKK